MLIYLKYNMSTIFGLMQMKKKCNVWDKKLNELLDTHWDTAVKLGATDCDDDILTVQLGNCLVWTGNRYYSYGYLYQHSIPEGGNWGRDVNSSERYRCKVKTMARLDKLRSDIKDAYIKKCRESHKVTLSEIR